MESEYVSAEEAAQLLGVSLTTLYAYVSRKGLRSQPLAGSRARRYWRADVERLLRRERRPPPVVGELRRESEITLITERGPYYRGRSAVDLARTASFETVAALLWLADEREVFTPEPPRAATNFQALDALLSHEAGVDRAIAHFPFLEQANPRAYDLSAQGMARTGGDILRWLTAIILKQGEASAAPIHLQFSEALQLGPDLAALVRQLLILSADHGFEQSTFAVRAVASTGVTPWRAVSTGLAVAAGRRSKFGNNEAMRRFLTEVMAADSPEEPVVRRLREGEILPGFNLDTYPLGDARAAALLACCDEHLSDDADYRRFSATLAFIRALKDLEPGFALVMGFIVRKLGLASRSTAVGLSSDQSPYLVGRAAGWIAHAIEQYGAGETGHRDVVYRGRLPEPPGFDGAR